MPPPSQLTPARSSLKGKVPRGKRSVSFMLDPPHGSNAPSNLNRSFGPAKKQRQNETIETPEDDENTDPNDRNYSTTDEEDEFQKALYGKDFSTRPEDESWDGQVDIEGKEDYETPVLAKSIPRRKSATVRKRVDRSDPITILRRNIDKNWTRQREHDANNPKYQPFSEHLPHKPKLRKGKVKISNHGSPQLQNTPDVHLRRQMNERDTPSGPAGSGFSSALENPGAFFKARRNLNDEYLGLAKTPAGPPPLFPLDDPAPPGLSPFRVITFNIAFFLLVSLSVFAITNGSEGLQKISHLPKSLSYAISNPRRSIPDISAAVIAVPQSIICSIIPCESTAIDRLKTITMIAADTTLDLTSLSQFADSITALGKPLILNLAGNSLAAEASNKSVAWRDSAATKTMEVLAHDYQNAHINLRLLVGGSQNFIRVATRKWVYFSGLLTDQIPREAREQIDLPSGWAINIPATRKKYSVKALRAHYRDSRKELAFSYQYIYSLTERSEKSIYDVLERTRKIHEAGIYESVDALEIIELLAESIGEIRKNIAHQLEVFGPNDQTSGELIGEDFTFGTLKWKVESLWSSVIILQDAAIGRDVKTKGGTTTVR